MGLLINGQWRDQWYDTSSSGGRFLRKDSAFLKNLKRHLAQEVAPPRFAADEAYDRRGGPKQTS